MGGGEYCDSDFDQFPLECGRFVEKGIRYEFLGLFLQEDSRLRSCGSAGFRLAFCMGRGCDERLVCASLPSGNFRDYLRGGSECILLGVGAQ